MRPSLPRTSSASSAEQALASPSGSYLTCDVPSLQQEQVQLTQGGTPSLANAHHAFHAIYDTLRRRRERLQRSGSAEGLGQQELFLPQPVASGDTAAADGQTAGALPALPPPAGARLRTAPVAGTALALARPSSPATAGRAGSPPSPGAAGMKQSPEQGRALEPGDVDVMTRYLEHRLRLAEHNLQQAQATSAAAEVPPQIYGLLGSGAPAPAAAADDGAARYFALPTVTLPDHCSGEAPLQRLLPADVSVPLARGAYRGQLFFCLRYVDLVSQSPGLVVLCQALPGQVGTQDWMMYNPQRFGPLGSNNDLAPRLLGLSPRHPTRLPAAPAARRMLEALGSLVREGRYVGRSLYQLGTEGPLPPAGTPPLAPKAPDTGTAAASAEETPAGEAARPAQARAAAVVAAPAPAVRAEAATSPMAEVAEASEQARATAAFAARAPAVRAEAATSPTAELATPSEQARDTAGVAAPALAVSTEAVPPPPPASAAAVAAPAERGSADGAADTPVHRAALAAGNTEAGRAGRAAAAPVPGQRARAGTGAAKANQAGIIARTGPARPAGRGSSAALPASGGVRGRGASSAARGRGGAQGDRVAAERSATAQPRRVITPPAAGKKPL